MTEMEVILAPLKSAGKKNLNLHYILLFDTLGIL